MCTRPEALNHSQHACFPGGRNVHMFRGCRDSHASCHGHRDSTHGINYLRGFAQRLGVHCPISRFAVEAPQRASAGVIFNSMASPDRSPGRILYIAPRGEGGSNVRPSLALSMVAYFWTEWKVRNATRCVVRATRVDVGSILYVFNAMTGSIYHYLI